MGVVCRLEVDYEGFYHGLGYAKFIFHLNLSVLNDCMLLGTRWMLDEDVYDGAISANEVCALSVDM